MANEKKYQIFISSTYEDLKEARSKVMDSILKISHFPIGMELFSAADEEQWGIIKNTIETSDYYIIIIGFRYGSLTPEGISYTEKEYDYAVSKNIPVLAFVSDRNVQTSKDERDEDQTKVNQFINKVQGRMRDSWTNLDDLANKILISLHKEFLRKPRSGWTRNDIIDNLNTTQEKLNIFESENKELELAKKEIERLLSLNRALERELVTVNERLEQTRVTTRAIREQVEYEMQEKKDLKVKQEGEMRTYEAKIEALTLELSKIESQYKIQDQLLNARILKRDTEWRMFQQEATELFKKYI